MLEQYLSHNQPSEPHVDDRRVISCILHILRTGGRWRDVPPEYGPAKTIYNRDTCWARRGIWQRISVKVAAAGPIPQELALASSNMKARRSASGGPEGPRQRKGGIHASGWRLARRPNSENPLFGRWSWPDRRHRGDGGQRDRRHDGDTDAGGSGADQGVSLLTKPMTRIASVHGSTTQASELSFRAARAMAYPLDRAIPTSERH